MWTIVGTVVAVVVAIVLIASSIPAVTAAATDIEPHIDKRTATLLELDPLTAVNVTAPAFTLTDQDGKPMSLAGYRGMPVVLSFNDDECTDLCTLLAQDVRAADTDLGTAAKKIAFVSINANPYYPSPTAVKQWDDQHGLGHEPNWHFGTGTPSTLATLAHQYGVPIDLDAKSKTVTHGAEIFFIDGKGHEQAIGQFGTESADTALFSHAVAQAADDLLPASEQTTVAGPAVPAPTSAGTQIGALPTPITLPSLSGATTLSTRTDKGKYTVIDFWSSTCTACIRGIPALEAEHDAVGKQVAFLGIDVSDPSASARAFATRYRVTFPLAADTAGSTAGRFAITGLPYTVILNPSGRVVIRHPGAFTTEQLDYLLKTLDTKLPSAS
ncbi:hypothetical protein AX769_21215 (plasmid) [Frondihabitans sp. PAMC 28766]|uniref:redoxin domain-containing protein n=1 Tax=Frondihabitans sp. PAMC 28766 TaxID=1795630 RepID=UPI00078BFCC2|nr:redoxin domain-containing protein [Frondihabitans sp. PAMC 28766]AMM22657.1 hypothetical protein AX769_21215 [Frondihabitans sp. PAMC 28766]